MDVIPEKHTVIAKNKYWQLQVERGVSKSRQAGLEFVLKPLNTWGEIKSGLRTARKLFQTIVDSVKETGSWKYNGFIVTPENTEATIVPTIAPQITTSFGLSEISTALDLAVKFKAYNSKNIELSLQQLESTIVLSELTPELQGFTKLVVATLACFKDENHFDEGPKEALPIMPRTDFHTMYTLLEEPDKEKFRSLITAIKSLFNPMIFKANMNAPEDKIPVREGAFHITNISVEDWIQSIISPPNSHGKDLLSPPRDYLTEHVKSYYTEYSMGALGLDSESRNPIFEFRCARKLMNYKPTTGGNLVENVRILFKNVTEVTEDKRRADSDTSSETIEERKDILDRFQKARRFLGGVKGVDTYWDFPTYENVSEIIKQIQDLPFKNEHTSRLCELLETAREHLQPIPIRENLSQTKFSILKLKIISSNKNLPIFTESIRPLCQYLLSKLDNQEAQIPGL